VVKITSYILYIKKLTARTNRGIHEGAKRKIVELRDQIEDNK